MIGRGFLLGGVLALAGTSLPAHPHATVDQQVALTLGLDRIAAEITIVPSIATGPDVLARLDTNADGVVADAEGQAFAEDVLATVNVQVANSEVALSTARISVSDTAALEAGLGRIVISAQANLESQLTGMADISFEIGFDDFDHDWFVQPYLQDVRIQESPIVIDRRGEGKVSVSFDSGS